MTTAYLDCFSGISGNMILGALIDAGLELDRLQAELTKLHLSGYTIRTEAVKRAGLTGTHVEVKVRRRGPERHLQDIEAIVTGSSLPPRIQERSIAVFRQLARAEAEVHGTSVDHVHFHEVGALDAIVDVVGAVIGFDLMGIDEIYASPVHIGRGTVRCAHGVIPVPAPATAELLKGVPTYGRDVDAELVTPTGAAILTTLAKSYGAAPAMTVEDIGYGAGSRDLAHPNLLRLSIGERTDEGAGFDYESDRVTLVETNIDDMNPEFYQHVMAQLFEAGAVDVFLTQITMKQSRPAVQLSILVPDTCLSDVIEVVFAETTTIGVRFKNVHRWKLSRSQVEVETPYGLVSVKVARQGTKTVNVAPEVQVCRRLARQHDVPIKDVYHAAQTAAQQHVARERDAIDESRSSGRGG